MKRLERYVENIKEIRKLSSLSLDDISFAEEYGDFLATNFVKIRVLAMENMDIIDKVLNPLLAPDRDLTDEEYHALDNLRGSLSDSLSLEDLDLHIANIVAQKLLLDPHCKDNIATQIKQGDVSIRIYCSLLNYYNRVSLSKDKLYGAFQQAEEIGDTFLLLLQEEQFKKLPDQSSKDLVLINSQYLSWLYESITGKSNVNNKVFTVLKKTLDLCDSSFYNEYAPDFDWIDYNFRTLKYISILTECNNRRGFSKAQLKEILKYSEKLFSMWKNMPNRKSFIDANVLEMFVLRNRYLNGVIDVKAYKTHLVRLYKGRNKHAHNIDSVYLNMVLPIEFMTVLDKENLSEREKRTLQIMYQNILSYIFSPKTDGILSLLLAYITKFLDNFIELAGGITFKELCLNILAALHVPTYVHTHMVADISRCLTEHIIKVHPELFAGMKGFTSIKKVKKNSEQIVLFAYEAALCHDIGKIPMLDTILVYGRKLLNEEFQTIIQHPDIGARLSVKHLSTRDYTSIIQGHHKWYDGSKGYPFSFDNTDLPEKTIIDIVMIADCLDAATDKIGRSYSPGKNLDDVIMEFRNEAGTHYSPYIIELFDKPEVIDDLNYLLDVKRRVHYEESYYLLRSMQDKEQ